jgi:diguanylate cyclase (GGDEF)-like protein/PAS domain S-box-containing protein
VSTRRDPSPEWLALAETVPDALVLIDDEARLVFANRAAEHVFGYAAGELVGRTTLQLIHPDDLWEAADSLRTTLDRPGEPGIAISLRVRRADGAWVAVELVGNNCLEVDGVGGVVLSLRDVSQRVDLAQALSESERRFHAVVRYASEAVILFDEHGAIRYASAALVPTTGWRPEELIGTPGFDLVHADDLEQVQSEVLPLWDRPGASHTVEFRLRNRVGAWRHCEGLFVNMLGDAAVGRVALYLRDITQRKEMEATLTHQALHDALTGLPNRVLLLDRLGVALERFRRAGAACAVLFCDLDRFKVVNDSDGHQVGDRLLVECARRLGHVLRDGDTVARFGGDEFVVLCADLTDPGDAVAVAERIAEALRAPFVVDGREFFVSTSIGIAYPDMGSHPDALLRDADAAMYRAKERGRAGHAVFEPEMRATALRRAELERSLRRAVDQGELRVHYQPIVELADGRTVGAEALLRWQHPERGLVGPLEFVSLAEDTGLIHPIGRWVVAQACGQLRTWNADGLLTPGFRLSVNLSLRELAQPDFVEGVAAALGASGVPPATLCFEVTESALADDAGGAVRVLRALRDLGVGLAIDDFGTGYSALSHLKRFPFDTIKLDRSFVDGLGRDAEDEAIVAAILGIARALRLSVVAEGIETPEQVVALLGHGVATGQGFHFSVPVEAEQLARRLAVVPAGRARLA